MPGSLPGVGVALPALSVTGQITSKIFLVLFGGAIVWRAHEVKIVHGVLRVPDMLQCCYRKLETVAVLLEGE